MSNKKTILINRIKFFVALLFVYVVIFQFILPVNKFLPKPSLFAESFLYIWKDYQLLIAISYTASLIYSLLILSYLFVFLVRGILIRFAIEYRQTILTLRLFRYVPLFMLLILFSYWFPASILAEYIFVVVLVIFYFADKIFSEVKHVKPEYVLVAKNLDVSKGEIYREVYWKEFQPGLFDVINHLQFYLWLVVLVYEFVGDAHGLGVVVRNALAFNDYTALLYFLLITTLVMWCFAAILNAIEKKLVFWNK